MPECKVRINNNREFSVEPGNSLYASLTSAGVFIPSACGGRGGCGLCRLRIASGAADQPFTRPELHWLSEKERADGVRLSCQVKVLNDICLQIPEKMLNVREYTAQVLSIRDLTGDIKEVRMKVMRGLEFRAGQYMQVKIPPFAMSPRPVFRSYSLAGNPAVKDEIEFEVRYVPNGISTTYIHKYLKPGDSLLVNGPHGEFFLRDGTREIIMIAGGSGMAPIKSILLDMAARKSKDPRRIRYFFGAKTYRDLFLVDLMRDFEKQLPDFRFIPALSEPLPDDDWKGETGLITEVAGRNIGDAASMDAYLCGSQLMVEACLKVLIAKGVPADRIFYDRFA